MTKEIREVRLVDRGHICIPSVRLGDVGRWSMVRRADSPTAAPFVISRKDWDRSTVQAEA